MTIIDISPALSPAAPVFPGDTPFSAQAVSDMSTGAAVTVSRLTLSPHTGAHADAPRHYDADGDGISDVDLQPYLGACAVLDLVDDTGPIGFEEIAERLKAVSDTPPRILLRTYQCQPTIWDDYFRTVSAEAIEWLASKKTMLIGVDTASLDPPSSKTMDAHRAVARADMRILENLKLDEVAEGLYELIALPLKIVGGDASPVRAVLRPLK